MLARVAAETSFLCDMGGMALLSPIPQSPIRGTHEMAWDYRDSGLVQ